MIKQINYNNKQSLYELKSRILFVIIALIVFRMGSFIPIPGIDVSAIEELITQQKGTIIEMLNMFSGGALSRASIFSLGIMPYISSSIIIQFLTFIHPKFIEMKKDGEIGRRKINKYIRYGTLILAIFQSLGISISLPSIPIINRLIIHPSMLFYFISSISLICGTILLMWIGEQITEKGIGNGISIIIFIGIIADLPITIIRTIEQIRQNNLNIILLIVTTIFIFIIIFLVVFIESGQRKIIVNYARRQHGRRMYSAQSTHLPLKINMSGVIPAIFASSIILFPTTIISWFSNSYKPNSWLHFILIHLQPGQCVHMILYSIAIIFFCFFYTTLVFNSRETADNLKKSGAFIPGIRPGEKTARYISNITNKLTLVGALYITIICLIPEFMHSIIKMPFSFGGTSLLIVIIVIMDCISHIQTIMISNQYDSIIKKANLR
ncbi:MAG: preprotein translocase subunit SecY [Candidatus Lightella neohaematopini]|nr:preprotein translocase subunit SecY [Candidatus Lightella neohaematopini]